MTTDALLETGDARFVALTTFRRSGVPVSTPVWVARDGDALVVTTAEGTGKVKRLRHDPHVTVQPCTSRGRVLAGTVPVDGVAEVVRGPRAIAAAGALKRKYGIQFRLVTLVARVRGSRRDRLILRIRPV